MTIEPAVPTGRFQRPVIDSVVEAAEVARTYGSGEAAVHALRGVSLEIERHKLTAVMGPSGSGKSTLMHILAGLDRPDSGRRGGWSGGYVQPADGDLQLASRAPPRRGHARAVHGAPRCAGATIGEGALTQRAHAPPLMGRRG